MKNYTAIFLAFIFIICNCHFVNAEQVSLQQVALEILQNSNMTQANEYSISAAVAEDERASKHWLPTLYINSSTYQTNDPTKILMGNLSQRAITQIDFTPELMNANTSRLYSKSSVGINIPLFQGGAGVAYANATQHIKTAKQYELKQDQLSEYAKIATIYISIVSLEQQHIKLLNLKNKVDDIVKKYFIGDKGNPIGYSGLLVLQTLQNKITALIAELNSKQQLLYSILRELGFKSKDQWQIASFTTVPEHINKYLNHDVNCEDSFSISSRQETVAAASFDRTIKKAKVLPKISLSAENYVFSGAKATKPGYAIGINLKWYIFNPATHNTGNISENNYAASRYAFLAQQQQEKTEIATLKSQIHSLEADQKLAIKNEQLILENIKISEDMFKNGLINAQLLADPISKYLDLFVFLHNIELQLIDTYAKKLAKQRIDISEILTTAV